MKLITVLFLTLTFSINTNAQLTTHEILEKNFEIISDCEITSMLANRIELSAVMDFNLNPLPGDSAQVLIKKNFTDASGYRNFEIVSIPVIIEESLYSDNNLVKRFSIGGDITNVKNLFKIGESMLLKWHATAKVEHSVEISDNGNIIYDGYIYDGFSVGAQILFKDGFKIESNHCLGYKHGTETYYENGTKVKELNWFYGELNGYVTTWYINNKIKSKVMYIDNSKENHAVSYYESGQLKKSIYYLGDRAHGQDYFYFESGKLMDDAHYKDGEYHGLVTKYYENGNIRFQQYRNEGVSHGSYLRNYESGAKEVRTNFFEGKLHGDYIDYYESGKKKSKGKYNHGEKIGKWYYWDKSGKKTVEIFEN